MQDAILAPTRPLANILLFVAPQIALALLIGLSPCITGVTRVGASLAIIAACIYTMCSYTTGNPTSDYGAGGVVLGSTILNITYHTWLMDPMADFRYLCDKDSSPLASRPIHERVFYAMCSIGNSRLVGWNVQVAHVPPRHKGTKAQYLLQRTRQCLILYLLMDLCETYIHQNRDAFPYPTNAWGISAAAAQRHHVSYWTRTCAAFMSATWVYCLLNLPYVVTSLVVCGSGMGRPEDWPDLCGNLSDAYTVRRFWGRAWHQMFRRHFSAWGKLAARALRIRRGTFLSAQVQVHVAFALSGLMHTWGDLMNAGSLDHFGRSMPFFLATGLVITFEDVVLAVTKRTKVGAELARKGPPRAVRTLGYVWVAIWVRYFVPLYLDWLFESGVGEGLPLLPFSPTRELFFS